MKKPNRLLPFSERTGLVIAASVTGALLLLALLLPLAFRRDASPGREEPVGAFGAEERAQLFSVWWTQRESGQKPRTEKLSDPGNATVKSCEERMREIVSLCVPDQGLDYASPTGSDFTRVIGTEGAINVCRMWLEAQGDWQNWLDVCFDADTGDIYYLYVSRSCLRNAERYRSDEPLSAERVAERLAAELDGTLRLLEPTEGGAVALVSVDGGTVAYSIGCVSYDRLIDVKVQTA